MSRRTLLVVVTAAFILQAGVMVSMIVRREVTLSRGERYRFRTAPIDPNDVFRGRYVSVDIQGDGPFTNTVQCKRGQRLYGALRVDDDGIAVIESVGPSAPENCGYITVKCHSCWAQQVKSGVVQTNFLYYCQEKPGGQWRWRGEQEVARNNLEYTKVQTNTVDKYVFTGKYLTTIKMPFDRYYMDEELAPEAERLYRENSLRDNQDAVLNVRVLNGYALIESLEVGGISIRDLILRQARSAENPAPSP